MLQSLTMGFLDAFKATQTMSHIDSQSTADLVAALAPANLIQQAVFNYGLAPTISRDLAVQVPAVARAKNIIAGTISSIPLEVRSRIDGSVLMPPKVINQPDPRVPGQTIYRLLVEDLIFYGVAYGQVLEVYEEYPNRIKSWTRIDPIRVVPELNAQGTEIVAYDLDLVGKLPIQGVGSLVVFSGDEGILTRGGRTIKTALELEKAAYNFALEPTPTIALKSTGANLPAERISKLLEAWKQSRQTRGTAFLNADIEMTSVGFDPKSLQLTEARQYLATEIARLMNIPAWYVSADTNSMTYSNVTSERRALVDFSLRPILTQIEQRLDQPDFTPQTQTVRYALDDFLRGNPLERAQVYEVLNRIGVLSVDEIRRAEDLVL